MGVEEYGIHDTFTGKNITYYISYWFWKDSYMDFGAIEQPMEWHVCEAESIRSKESPSRIRERDSTQNRRSPASSCCSNYRTAIDLQNEWMYLRFDHSS